MADRTPSEALEAWLRPLRLAVQCVGSAEIFAATRTVGLPNYLQLVARDSRLDNFAPLRITSGEMALNLGVFLLFAIEPGPTVQVRPGYHVRIFGYRYEVVDEQGRELFVYHWHPSGRSQNRDPHLHISAAPLRLTGGRSRQVDRKLPIDKAHFPTGHITLQQVTHLLIEDLSVEPRMPNWREILLPAVS